MPPPTIALAFNFSLAYCRRILSGIKDFSRNGPDWALITVAPEGDLASALATTGAQGVIAHVYSASVAAQLVAARLPLVNVAGVVAGLPIARVGIDNDSVGRLAAQHFMERGFTSLAFLGHAAVAAAEVREQGFVAAAAAAGLGVAVHRLSRGQRFNPDANAPDLDAAAQQWIAGLPARTAIFAYCDILGVQAAEACRRAGRALPEDVALLGVDDDDLLCDLSWVPLSSVQVPAEAIGRHAAAELLRQIEGQVPRCEPLLFPPMGISVRQSSDITAIDDPLVAAAVRSIHHEYHREIAIGQLLKGSSLSRRTLERRFRAVLGRGMWDEIRRVRIDAAARLLANTDLPMPEVARRAGFSDAKRLSLVIRQALGVPPSLYRRRYRVS